MFGYGDSGDDLIVVTPTRTSTYYWLHGGVEMTFWMLRRQARPTFASSRKAAPATIQSYCLTPCDIEFFGRQMTPTTELLHQTAGADLVLQVVFTNYNLDFAIMDRRYYFDAGDIVSTDSGAMTPFQTRFYDNVGANQFAAVQSDTTVEVRMNSTGSRENFLYLEDANGGSRVIVETVRKERQCRNQLVGRPGRNHLQGISLSRHL